MIKINGRKYMNLKQFFSLTESPVANMELFSLSHILWIVIPLLLTVAGYFLFKKYPKAGKIILFSLAMYLIVVRLIKNILFKSILWNEGWDNIIPFQLCGVMIYALPFTVFFKTKKLNRFIYPLALMGGFIMMLYPDWVFNGGNMNFNKIESLIAHFLIVFIPITSIAVDRFKFEVKDIYKPLLALLLLTFYAHIGNLLIPNRNYMFLQTNPLPFQIPGIHHIFTFGLIFIVLMLLLYSVDIARVIARKIKKKSN